MAPKKNYTQAQMAKAIEEVRRGQKISVAATKHGVPRITLHNKVTGKSPEECSMGPDTILSKEEETILVKWILYMADKHFPVTKDQLLDSVQKIIMEKNQGSSCPFTNQRPGKKWYSSFLKRHPEIAQRTAQNLSKAREDVTEEDLKEWFKTNTEYLKNRGLYDLITTDPRRVFNTDETAFFLQPKPGRVLVRKGEKNVYNSSGDEKENLTVLITGNAAGEVAPPMIVFPYERLPAAIANSVPTGWAIGRSDTGWMCARTFFEYVCNVFNPWLINNNIPKPVVFFLDGHRSHMTLHLSNFCNDNGIEIIALYPNSTHLLQPMDVSVFRPLKYYWKNQVTTWKTQNPGKRLKKENFAPNLQAALLKVSSETIKNGFRKSGLYPFGPEFVDMAKISLQNRSEQPESRIIKKSQFMKTLESEIKNTFSHEKLTMFNRLFYMQRADVENHLPDEDQSLYIVWAKTKNTLGGYEHQNIENQVQTIQRMSIQDQITTEQNIPGLNVQKENTLEQSIEDNNSQGLNTQRCTMTELNAEGANARREKKEQHGQGMISTEQNTQGLNENKENIKENTRKENAHEKIMPEQNRQLPNVQREDTQEQITEDRYVQGQNIQGKITTEHNIQRKNVPVNDTEEQNAQGQIETENNTQELNAEGEKNEEQNAQGQQISENTIDTQGSNIQRENTEEQNTKEKIETEKKTQELNAEGEKKEQNAQGQTMSVQNTQGPKVQRENTEEQNAQGTTEQNTQGQKKESIDHPNRQETLKQPFSTAYTTPRKSVETDLTVSYPSTSKTFPKDVIIPSPFKRVLFWPEPETKKRRTKERVPSAITSEVWRNYMEKKENEKKKKEQEKEQRKKERKDKKILKEKMILEKKQQQKRKKKIIKQQDSSSGDDMEIQYAESGDSEYDESGKSDSENEPLSKMASQNKTSRTQKTKSITNGSYVIVKYEGEYFPGKIEQTEGDLHEISTMVLSAGHSFRWPDKPDKIWYRAVDVIEKIVDPLLLNKRGFYKIPEMEKYLPDIYSI